MLRFEPPKKQLLMENQVIKLHDYDGAVQFLCAEIYRRYMKKGCVQNVDRDRVISFAGCVRRV